MHVIKQKTIVVYLDLVIHSVSFHALSAGGGGLNAADVITAMLKGFEKHLSRCAPTVLKLVYVVIDKDDILKDVLQGLQLWKTRSTVWNNNNLK